jgi:hypothetical protein
MQGFFQCAFGNSPLAIGKPCRFNQSFLRGEAMYDPPGNLFIAKGIDNVPCAIRVTVKIACCATSDSCQFSIG